MSEFSINNHFTESAKLFNKLPELSNEVEAIAKIMLQSLEGGGRIFWFGNGGSASDAEHLAAELSGKYEHDRKPLDSIALTANTSVLTAIANDFGYENVFSRQVHAHARAGDVVIGISTSGSSKNVLMGLEAGADLGAITILLTGNLAFNTAMLDYVIQVPSSITAHIQEAHIAIGQAICGYIENAYL